MDANQATAEQLRATLARRRITGTRLAEMLGTNAMWAQRRMSGSVPITVNDLDRIATALDVPLSDLLPEKASA